MGKVVSLLAVALLAQHVSAAEVLKTAQEVRAAAYGSVSEERRFELTATVTFTRQEDDHVLFAVEDASGHVDVNLYGTAAATLVPGLKLRLSGRMQKGDPFHPAVVAETISRVGESPAPRPTDVSGPDLIAGGYDCRLTRISGVVRDVSVSELNPNWTFLVVNCQGRQIYVSLPAHGQDIAQMNALVDTEISAVGICLPLDCTFRTYMGRVFKVAGVDSICPKENPPPSLAKTLPDIASIGNLAPQDIALLGRHRAEGFVLAVWGVGEALLRTDDGRLVHLEFATGPVPAYGARIEASGLPETDLFQINLTRATWRGLPDAKMHDDEPTSVRAHDIQKASASQPHINRAYQGRAIRLKGEVVCRPQPNSPDQRLYLMSDTQFVPVEARVLSDRLADIPVESTVEISGICIMGTETWRPNMIFTKTKGFFLVPRTSGDIRVLARPSWWTPGRLTAVIGALFALLVGVLGWNFLLQRLSDRKGRALAKARIANTESLLKVQERTRLATELHDTIVQNLTGAAMELRTADKTYDSDPAVSRQQLALALKTLDACRNEIRNCIWDLRSRALDETSMETAIRRTLAPFEDDARLAVRFAVPRERLTDNTAHALIRIVRELVLNATRHGKSGNVRVAGCMEDGNLLFSVQDDGCGFDADAAPGIGQGHFGLQGIRERIDALHGKMTVRSERGKGTHVSFEVPLSMEGKN